MFKAYSNHKNIRERGSMIKSLFSLNDGQATFQCPENLTQEEYEDLVTWIELLLKRTKRSVKLKAQNMA